MNLQTERAPSINNHHCDYGNQTQAAVPMMQAFRITSPDDLTPPGPPRWFKGLCTSHLIPPLEVTAISQSLSRCEINSGVKAIKPTAGEVRSRQFELKLLKIREGIEVTTEITHASQSCEKFYCTNIDDQLDQV